MESNYHELVQYIQQRLEQTRRVIEGQLHECTLLVTQFRENGGATPSGQKSHQVLSIVPATADNQKPTLLFTPETEKIFSRTALNRELFSKLKGISKCWLANVDENKRKQATKISQEVAKAVCDLRVNTITREDLKRYRQRIQTSFGGDYNIPIDELSKAFSKKIRVYLQNTKSKHKDWIERFKGVDITAPKIIVDTDAEEFDNDAANESQDNDDAYDSSEDEAPVTSRIKREVDDSTNSDITYFPQHLFASAQFPTPPPLEEILAVKFTMDPEQYRKTVFNYCTYEIKTRLCYSPDILIDAYVIYTAYCVCHSIYGVSLSDMCGFLQQTALRLMGGCFPLCGDPRTRNPIHASITMRKDKPTSDEETPMDTDPDPNDQIFKTILTGGPFCNSNDQIGSCIVAAFVDYAAAAQRTRLEDWMAKIESQRGGVSLATQCLTELGVAATPGLCAYGDDAGNAVILLMYCSLQQRFSLTIKQSELPSLLVYQLFALMSDSVLSDMLDPKYTGIKDGVLASIGTEIDQWQPVIAR